MEIERWTTTLVQLYFGVSHTNAVSSMIAENILFLNTIISGFDTTSAWFMEVPQNSCAESTSCLLLSIGRVKSEGPKQPSTGAFINWNLSFMHKNKNRK